MDAVRTPEARFAGLPDFPWAPRYTDNLPGYSGLRMAYLDEGPRDGHTYLCLHGEPSWSFLYRKMIPVFLDDGARIVAPDLFGFGRSDKPTDDAVYSFDFHRGALLALVDSLGLRQVTLVCQDWGGLLGLTLPVDRPDLIARLIIMNTTFGVGATPPESFHRWLAHVRRSPDLNVGAIMQRNAPGLTDAEAAAYDAPFPDVTYKAGARTFPGLVPITRDAPGAALSRQALRWWRAFDGDAFMAIGMQDPILGPHVMRPLHGLFPRCGGPLELPEAGHFVQEQGDVVARAALAWFAR